MNKQIKILNDGIKNLVDLTVKISENEHKLTFELRDKKKEFA